MSEIEAKKSAAPAGTASASEEVQDHWRYWIDDTSERLTVRKVKGWLRRHPCHSLPALSGSANSVPENPAAGARSSRVSYARLAALGGLTQTSLPTKNAVFHLQRRRSATDVLNGGYFKAPSAGP